MNDDLRQLCYGLTVIIVTLVLCRLPLIGSIITIVISPLIVVYLCYYLGKDAPIAINKYLLPYLKKYGIDITIKNKANTSNNNKNNNSQDDKPWWN